MGAGPEHWRTYLTEAQRSRALVDRIAAFVAEHDDDIALGVRRLIHPPTLCDQCGQVDDFGVAPCACWSALTAGDVDQLRARGLDLPEEEA